MIDLGQIRDIETLRNVFFGVCDTYTDVATKIVTAPGYTPEEGKLLVVKFNYEVNLWDPTNEEWMRLYMNVNGSGAMYVETYTYTYTYPDGTERYYELMGGMVQTPVYAVFTYYEFSADDKGYRLVCTSGTLGMLGEMFERISAMPTALQYTKYGVCTSPLYTTAMTVSIDGFELKDGATAMVRFTNGIRWQGNFIPVFTLNINGTGAKRVSVWGDMYGLTYGTNAIVGTDVIAMLVYLEYYNLYFIVWTSIDMQRLQHLLLNKQDALPPVANNAGKVLAVNSAADGLEWVAQQGITQIKTVNGQSMAGTGDIATTPAYTHYYYTISDNTPLTITCPSGKRSHYTIVVQGYNGATAPAITINIRNLCDNEIVILDSSRAITAFPVSVKFNGVDAVVLSKSDNGWGIVDDSNSLLIYTKGLNVMLRMKAVPFNEFNAGHYVTVVGHLLETVYEPQQS